MTIAGLLTPFVVPPVNLAVLAALAELAGRRRLALVALVALLLLALPVVSGALMTTLERDEAAGDPAGAQAIVVLGAEVTQQGDGRTLPGLLSLQRLRAAAELARRTGLPILVSGGVTEPGAAPVAVAMADSLRTDFDLPARWVEDRSADTLGNARDSAALLATQGPAQRGTAPVVTTVLLVTNQWHMRRALLAFRAAGLRAISTPVPAPAARPFGVRDLIPRVSAWMESYYALHEWIGIAWYALRISL